MPCTCHRPRSAPTMRRWWPGPAPSASHAAGPTASTSPPAPAGRSTRTPCPPSVRGGWGRRLEGMPLTSSRRRVGQSYGRSDCLDAAPRIRRSRPALPRGLLRHGDDVVQAVAGAGEELLDVACGLADAVLVLDQGDAHEALPVLAEAQARRDGNVG